MKRNLITALLIAAWLPTALASSVGTTGNPLLRLPLGAAPAAMGDAYCAMSGTPSVITYNPAALSTLTNPVLTAHYQKRFLDLRVSSLQGAYPLPVGTLGAGLDYFSEGYIHETIHGLPTGSDLHSYSTRLLLGYGLPLYHWLEAGANVAWHNSVIAEEDGANSFTADLGFRFPRFYDKFSGALTFNNLGTSIAHDAGESESQQPVGMRMGLLYDAFADQQSAMIWLSTLDLIAMSGSGTKLAAGSELTLQQFYDSPLDVVLRGGLQLADLETAHFPLTLGFGLIFQDFALDYAFETFSDIGTVSRISFTFQPRRLPGDMDQDGVIDPDDLCPDTPVGALVDEYGCPLDSDADGVFDGIDLCPHTPQGALVDDTGCPLDSDGDGVFDGIDRCPDTPPDTRVDMFGCELTQVEYEFLETGLLRLQDINFASNQAVIESSSFAELDRIGNLLAKWNQLFIEIGGHTDSQGTDEHNLQLSADRAKAVLQYLLDHFPSLDEVQLTTNGYGETQSIADNSTIAGRGENRRVEFRILSDNELRREKDAEWLNK